MVVNLSATFTSEGCANLFVQNLLSHVRKLLVKLNLIVRVSTELHSSLRLKTYTCEVSPNLGKSRFRFVVSPMADEPSRRIRQDKLEPYKENDTRGYLHGKRESPLEFGRIRCKPASITNPVR